MTRAEQAAAVAEAVGGEVAAPVPQPPEPPPDPVADDDVFVADLYRAECDRRGCRWTGELYDDRDDAETEAQAHLAEHRKEERAS